MVKDRRYGWTACLLNEDCSWSFSMHEAVVCSVCCPRIIPLLAIGGAQSIVQVVDYSQDSRAAILFFPAFHDSIFSSFPTHHYLFSSSLLLDKSSLNEKEHMLACFVFAFAERELLWMKTWKGAMESDCKGQGVPTSTCEQPIRNPLRMKGG